MGLNLKDLVVRERISLEALSSRAIAIDAYNALYQFFSNIRDGYGKPLTDAEGNPTGHLSGVLHRNSNLLAAGIKPIWVFDGKPPSLKAAEIERRKAAKTDAIVKYELAVAQGDMQEARKYAQQTTSLTDRAVEETITLLGLFGTPCIRAPSEGEATAAHLAIRGHAWAAASQDYDTILFGAPRLVRNFALSGRRKVANKNFYVNAEPELVHLEQVLQGVQLDRRQLVDAGILVGTDFNPGGVRRIGPKTAVKLLQKHGRLEDIPQIQEQLDGIPFEDIRKIFLEPEVADTDGVEFGSVDQNGIVDYLAGRSFSRDRVSASLNKITKSARRRNSTLERWF